MATAAEEICENIRDQFLQCKICLDGLKMPKTLPCLHTFCAECLVYYIEHNRIDSRKFSCPICRRHIYIPKNGVVGFPDSFFVSNLTDIVATSEEKGDVGDKDCGICKYKEGSVEAVMLCVECKMQLCEGCANTHTSVSVTKDHTMLPLVQGGATASRENYCRIHKGETIKFYCDTCNSPICLPCTFLDHKGHEIQEIKSVRQNFCQDISGMVMTSEDNIFQLLQTKDDLIEIENELFVRKESIKTEIRRSIQDHIKMVNEQELLLTQEVDKFYDTVSIGKDRQKLERTMFRLERAHDFAKQLMSPETSPIAQMVNRTEAKDNLNQALAYELPDVTVHVKKLDNYISYLPGKVETNLGSLLKCTTHGQSKSISELQIVVPSTKALFLHKLKVPEGGTSLGEVVSIAYLPPGNIVLLTTASKKIKIFNGKGRLVGEFGEDEDLLHPSDIAVTCDGEVAVSDCGYLAVKIFDNFGVLKFMFGNAEVFGLPISLTIDNIGRFMVCDQAKQRVTIHRTNGELLHKIPISEIELPQYIKCHVNHVYICDTDHKIITIYNYNGDEMQFVAKLNGSDDQCTSLFLDCSCIAMDKNGCLFVSDTIQNKVHIFNTKGEMSSVFPSGNVNLRPTCLAVSTEGLLAVCQQGVTDLDSSEPSSNEVSVYKMVRADI